MRPWRGVRDSSWFLASKFRFKFFDARQASFQGIGQRLNQFRLPLGDSDRLGDIPQCVFCRDPVAGLAQDQANGRGVAGMSHLRIDGGQIKIHLAGIFGRELLHLKVDDHKASQFEMVEQEIEVEVFVADHDMHLPPHERETGPELQQKLLDVIDQPGLEVAFDGLFVQREEVEEVRVFERLLRQV
jgi:hypothetical protein